MSLLRKHGYVHTDTAGDTTKNMRIYLDIYLVIRRSIPLVEELAISNSIFAILIVLSSNITS